MKETQITDILNTLVELVDEAKDVEEYNNLIAATVKQLVALQTKKIKVKKFPIFSFIFFSFIVQIENIKENWRAKKVSV